MIILTFLLNYSCEEKQSGKKDAIEPIGSSSFKIVFALLTKLVVV